MESKIPIIEANLVSKTGNPETCEDTYCITENYVCVIDGATNVSGKLYNGLTPGQVVARVIEQTIPTLPKNADLSTAIQMINRNLISYYKEQGIYESILENPYSRPSASMVLYSRYHHVVWMVGDCQCMIDGELYENTKFLDEITANARSLFLEAEIQKGKTVQELLENDTGFEAVRPFIRAQYYMQNLKEETQYSYVAITGFDFDIGKIKVVEVPQDAKELVLASDGYPTLRPTLEASEAELKYILDHDPLCFRIYKLAKGLKKGHVSFDDRTYVKVPVTTRNLSNILS